MSGSQVSRVYDFDGADFNPLRPGQKVNHHDRLKRLQAGIKQLGQEMIAAQGNLYRAFLNRATAPAGLNAGRVMLCHIDQELKDASRSNCLVELIRSVVNLFLGLFGISWKGEDYRSNVKIDEVVNKLEQKGKELRVPIDEALNKWGAACVVENDLERIIAYPTSEGFNLLVVDDDRTAATSAHEFLDSWGHIDDVVEMEIEIGGNFSTVAIHRPELLVKVHYGTDPTKTPTSNENLAKRPLVFPGGYKIEINEEWPRKSTHPMRLVGSLIDEPVMLLFGTSYNVGDSKVTVSYVSQEPIKLEMKKHPTS